MFSPPCCLQFGDCSCTCGCDCTISNIVLYHSCSHKDLTAKQIIKAAILRYYHSKQCFVLSTRKKNAKSSFNPKFWRRSVNVFSFMRVLVCVLWEYFTPCYSSSVSVFLNRQENLIFAFSIELFLQRILNPCTYFKQKQEVKL